MIRIRRNPLPSPKKIMKRGLYEIMWGAPQRDYGKYVGLDNKKKKEPWRIVVFILSVLFIVFMWIKNDILTIYTTMPEEQIIPLIATTIAVSLIKVAAFAGIITLIKWIIGKIKTKITTTQNR